MSVPQPVAGALLMWSVEALLSTYVLVCQSFVQDLVGAPKTFCRLGGKSIVDMCG